MATHATIVTQISQEMNGRYLALQKQHQEFAAHLNGQIAALEHQLMMQSLYYCAVLSVRTTVAVVIVTVIVVGVYLLCHIMMCLTASSGSVAGIVGSSSTAMSGPNSSASVRQATSAMVQYFACYIVRRSSCICVHMSVCKHTCVCV